MIYLIHFFLIFQFDIHIYYSYLRIYVLTVVSLYNIIVYKPLLF